MRIFFEKETKETRETRETKGTTTKSGITFLCYLCCLCCPCLSTPPLNKKIGASREGKLRKGYYLRLFSLMAVIFSRKPPSFEKLSHTRSMYFVVSDIACLISMITIFAIVLSGRLSASSIKYFGSLCSTANLAIVDASSE